MGTYRKIHLPYLGIDAHVDPGDRPLAVHVVNGLRIGVQICYDGSFPEHAMAASEAGATAYLCPSAYFRGAEHRRDLRYASRALDNGIYVVLAGLTGSCGRYAFSGGSAVYDPEGRYCGTLVGDRVVYRTVDSSDRMSASTAVDCPAGTGVNRHGMNLWGLEPPFND